MKDRYLDAVLAGAMTTAVALTGIVILGQATDTDLWSAAERSPAGPLFRGVRAVVRKVVNP